MISKLTAYLRVIKNALSTAAKKIAIFLTALNFSAQIAAAQTFEINSDAFTAAQSKRTQRPQLHLRSKC